MSMITARAATEGSATAAARPLLPPRPDAAIHSELRPLSECEAIRREWTELAGRALEANPCLEPGFALPAAQHLVSFRDAALMLLWQGDPGSQRRHLVGLVPCRRRRRLFAAEALEGFADPRLMNGTPLIDGNLAAPALAAFLRGWQGPAAGSFTLSGLDPAGAFAATLARVAEGQGVTLAWQPLPGHRPAAPAAEESPREKGRLSLVEAINQADRRDAVEIMLALEASGARGRAGQATLQDTREVGFLRSMSRDLGRRKLCRPTLLTLDGRPIAGALTLGRGASSWLYLGVADEAFAPLAPLAVLLAMMRKAAPSRRILLPGGFGTLRLAGPRPQRPAALAARLGERIGRPLFRLRPAAADG
ncbi:GNAT family N-acetyltransferase [Bosea sp. (in: a-proteobacteria)]|uniref:GNAT family N-acetyltransferase n=1 Tax=Bosea sp. (in: a-proteobacteria) TaxID=1871050 RepID=UPI00262B2455|nr:GNAT family N-acetyltransferase [Bosea sp. (in: a-proteobacteria)]MCO5090860.1 GNAT family N-acetyltransferase [Bosea sp. (in: a-proteobacteria)]